MNLLVPTMCFFPSLLVVFVHLPKLTVDRSQKHTTSQHSLDVEACCLGASCVPHQYHMILSWWHDVVRNIGWKNHGMPTIAWTTPASRKWTFPDLAATFAKDKFVAFLLNTCTDAPDCSSSRQERGYVPKSIQKCGNFSIPMRTRISQL